MIEIVFTLQMFCIKLKQMLQQRNISMQNVKDAIILLFLGIA